MPWMKKKNKPAPWVARVKEDHEAKRMYNSEAWRKYRRKYLSVHPLCVVCEREATVVDHVTPVRVRPEWFWRADNHQAMCEQCHNSKRATED